MVIIKNITLFGNNSCFSKYFSRLSYDYDTYNQYNQLKKAFLQEMDERFSAIIFGWYLQELFVDKTNINNH